jgi:hypothetical protein
MASLMAIEHTFPSSKPVSLSLSPCLDIQHDDDDDAFSVDLDATLVDGKTKFVFGDAM